MKMRYRFIGISLLTGLLVLIKFYEESLFYDPLIDFYELAYLHNGEPQFELPRLLINLSMRFWLNTLISLGILYVAFFEKSIVKFSLFLFLILFILGIGAFIYELLNFHNGNYMGLFYVRRFLIHPIFLLILLPAFYYQRLKSRRKKKRISSVMNA